MGGLFGGASSNATTPTAAAGIRVQTSVEGVPIPLPYGKTRIAGNLIWVGDFQAIKTTQSVGGKGGGGGQTTGYTYKASYILGICEGPIHDIPRIWGSKKPKAFSKSVFASGVKMLGTYPQAAWGFLTAHHAAQALGYQGLALVGGANLDLGTNPEVPNHNFEVEGFCWDPDVDDANPADVATHFLTDPHCGAGFPVAKLGDLTLYQTYCKAANLLISPAFSQQQAAADSLKYITDLTNAAIVWTGGQLKIIPYGDLPITANGVTYTPPDPVPYSLTHDDFKTQQDDPVQNTRTRRADAYNIVPLEYWDRSSNYDPKVVKSTDQAAVELYGERPDSSHEAHCICVAGIARKVAQLQLQRLNVLNTYTFILGWEYALLEPMDLVPITEPGLGLDAQLVRITAIDEDADGYLTVTAEEYIEGLGTAEDYATATGTGYRPDYDADPGDVNPPIIFEPPEALVTAKGGKSPTYQIWGAVSGGSEWGGCDVWVSDDGGVNYYKVTTINSQARQGVLLASLAAAAGANPDVADTLSVDLTESAGTLVSGSVADASTLFNTLLWVDGEFIGYETATLGTQYQYALTTLYRGLFGTAKGAHALGAQAAFIDASVYDNPVPYNANLIGQEVYIKFLSFNLYGENTQTLDEAAPYTFTPTGASANWSNDVAPDTDTTLAAASDVRVATQKATKSYIDTGLSAKQGALPTQPHIAPASGTLPDITTKFNTLLTELQTRTTLASS